MYVQDVAVAGIPVSGEPEERDSARARSMLARYRKRTCLQIARSRQAKWKNRASHSGQFSFENKGSCGLLITVHNIGRLDLPAWPIDRPESARGYRLDSSADADGWSLNVVSVASDENRYLALFGRLW